MFSYKQFFLIVVINFSNCPVDSQKMVATKPSEPIYRLNKDTLIISTGQNIYVGQKLIAGKGVGKSGWFHTIGFKSDFSWPIWFMREVETKYNYDYQSDPQKRVNDKVQEYLHEGDTLIVTKLKKEGNKRSGYWYTAFLKSQIFPKISWRSTIAQSIIQKELVVP